jgi:aerobic carbon-monoxide dehydrogenase small subunit
MKALSLSVNNESVEALAEPRTHLADFLRDQLRLTGTHLGCEHGVCGACTVLIDGQPARACIAYAVQCEGAEVRTIEGFEDDALMNELRVAFSREHALQCGFCTPGMLIAARDLVLRLPGADERRIREEMSGNLCRCTGYLGIVRAIQSVAAAHTASNDVLRPESPKSAPVARFVPAEGRVEGKAKTAAIASGTRIEDEFTVNHPLAKVWAAFADMPAVAACLPGAEITEHTPSSAKGRINVKFGPMRAAFAGGAALERDEAAKRGLIRGAGQDSLSSSRARGDISYQLKEAEKPGTTRIVLSIDYSLQGPLAQFSRGGLVKEFVATMVAQFAINLDRHLAGQGSAAPAATLDAGSVFRKWLWKTLFRRPNA